MQPLPSLCQVLVSDGVRPKCTCVFYHMNIGAELVLVLDHSSHSMPPISWQLTASKSNANARTLIGGQFNTFHHTHTLSLRRQVLSWISPTSTTPDSHPFLTDMGLMIISRGQILLWIDSKYDRAHFEMVNVKPYIRYKIQELHPGQSISITNGRCIIYIRYFGTA